MDPAFWRKLEEIYHQALEQPPENRKAFIEKNCGGDENLRAKVESLLSAENIPDAQIDHPAWEGAESLVAADSPLPAGRQPDGGADPGSPGPGGNLGHFTLLEKIGEGGMGRVYKARDQRLARLVAIKLLPENCAHEADRRARFVREAKAASALNHPNIITIHEIGEQDRQTFIVMELVAGKPLSEIIPPKGLPLRDCLRIAVQVADALSAAHAAQIIHRDLKPANIMVDASGRIKVLDFGLAKLTVDSPSLGSGEPTRSLTVGPVRSAPGMIVGSFPYMSPEQAEGKKLDSRSDIFSFGAVLYEMVTGRRAFRGDSAASTLAAVLREEPTAPTLIAPDVPRELERIIQRCLRKDPDRRFHTMNDVKVELEEVREESEPAVQAANQKTRSRSRVGWYLAAAVVVIGLAALRFGGPLAAIPPDALHASLLTSFVGEHGAPSLSPDGNQYVFEWDGDVPGKLHLYLSLIGKGTPLRLTPENEFAGSPAWSPDGQSIAFIKQNDAGADEVTVIPALGGNERHVATAAAISDVTWSPDSRWLLWCQVGGAGASIFIAPSGGGEARRLLDHQAAKGYGFAKVSPDGRQVVYEGIAGDFDSDLFVSGFQDGKLTGQARRLTFDHIPKSNAVWTADGKEIVYVSGSWFTTEAGIRRVPVAGGAPGSVEGIGVNASELTYSSKARRLIYSTVFINYDIHRLDLRNPHAKPERFLSSSRFESSPSYSPDGKRIAFDSNRGGTHQIWVADADGTNPFPVTSFKIGLTGSGLWSPDGQSLVFDARPGSNADVYTIPASGGQVRKLTDFPGEDHNGVWSVDGKWIYFASRRAGNPEIFRMHGDGSGVQQMTNHGGILPRVSLDGKWLYYSVANNGIWKMPVDGGAATQALTKQQIAHAYTFTVTAQGIYGMAAKGPNGYPIVFYPFDGSSARTLIEVDRPIYLYPAISPDGHYLLYTTRDDPVFEMRLVDNFR